MEEQFLDFANDDALAGFRLQTLEVYNWGTFHKNVWRLDLHGKNGLLTGDIGSGKSTLVDAVTTLLVPAHRVAYNKAAGAEIKERSLRSYVLGYFKSERSDSGLTSKSVALRDHNSFSVILGVFSNGGYNQKVTLAQVFWSKESQGQPERFYVVSDRELSITEHFSDFGPDIAQLKKRLKKTKKISVFDTFPKYGAAFRRRFGIENEQALSLFHQTVSMKSVGNLTDFVRDHMLEAFDVKPRIDVLIHHFDDLSRAHDAVLRAKHQIDRLMPLVADCAKLTELTKEKTELRECREALRPFFALHKRVLYKRRLAKLEDEQDRMTRKIKNLDLKRREQMGERDEIRQSIAENGGDRLERIRSEIRRLTLEKEKRMERADRYNVLAKSISLKTASSQESFEANAVRVRDQRQSIEKQDETLQNQRTDTEVAFRGLKSEYDDLKREIDSLAGRKNNIHTRQIKIRQDLCAHLSLNENELPFAGELIQVREEEKSWEGAAERLLHNFGLSLLVPEKYYRDVAGWVDITHLRGRLVYYLVRMTEKETDITLHAESLVRKLSVKPDSPFYIWMENELGRRFDYACCSDIRQFHREPRAITEKGQLKSGGRRHEKDDRRNIKDRSQYILGWSNLEKIRALKKDCRELEGRMQTLAKTLTDLDAQKKELNQSLNTLIRLGEVHDFIDLDWKSVTREISRLEEEKKGLEADSDILKTLENQLQRLEEEMENTDTDLRQARDTFSKNQEKQNVVKLGIKDSKRDISAQVIDEKRQIVLVKILENMRVKELGKRSLTLESCDSRERELRAILQKKIDGLDDKTRTLETRITKTMHGYRIDYPAETSEVDDSVASGPEYEEMLNQLQTDNLPRFEKRFKELLNENTIREVANFQSQLFRERETIRERIERINQSLSDIEYNPGRYIVLEAQLNPDVDIREFQQQLRACTEGALTGSDEDYYSESKFTQVRAVIERFRGREGMSDLDKRWTKKVTDVRNWFVFAASERWREDHSEYEHYRDSGGKSGGQKEKLAYTVLAASLAYQFGLEWGAVKSRTFRFVAIDEAFGRGSDESTRYSLELFKKLKLQLLIITPLQKIHIIEPYVSSVGLVYNPDGQVSQLRNMTVQEYREERKEQAS